MLYYFYICVPFWPLKYLQFVAMPSSPSNVFKNMPEENFTVPTKYDLTYTDNFSKLLNMYLAQETSKQKWETSHYFQDTLAYQQTHRKMKCHILEIPCEIPWWTFGGILSSRMKNLLSTLFTLFCNRGWCLTRPPLSTCNSRHYF